MEVVGAVHIFVILHTILCTHTSGSHRESDTKAEVKVSIRNTRPLQELGKVPGTPCLSHGLWRFMGLCSCLHRDLLMEDGHTCQHLNAVFFDHTY